MKSRPKFSTVFMILLFGVACVLGIAAQRNNEGENAYQPPRAQYKDATPLGGKGLRLLLERLGYNIRLTNKPLTSMPTDARVWLILDPKTQFTKREAEQLLDWVKQGGTLLWNVYSAFTKSNSGKSPTTPALSRMWAKLSITPGEFTYASPRYDEPLPPLTPLTSGSANIYWSGVKQASASNDGFEIKGRFLELAGSPVLTQLARIDYGRGRVFIIPSALLFTNYALNKPDNAVLVTNMISAHVPAGSGAVYFDERQHGETATGAAQPVEPSLLYYLWQPPLRYALLQLLAAGLLLWAYYGRRLGTPVPLPETDPVTRAGQFAVAMGMLFQKAGRPRAAGTIIGEEFRRTLARRLGMSVAQSDEEIAQRASAVTGLPAEMIARLLLKSRAPDENEAGVLNDTQEMEYVLRRLRLH